MSEICVSNCDFQKFKDGTFSCKYYDKVLDAKISMDIEDDGAVVVNRCKECIKDGIIGSSTILEVLRKLHQHLGLIMDSFYSFKDDMEEEATKIYRIIKSIESEEMERIKYENNTMETD